MKLFKPRFNTNSNSNAYSLYFKRAFTFNFKMATPLPFQYRFEKIIFLDIKSLWLLVAIIRTENAYAKLDTS